RRSCRGLDRDGHVHLRPSARSELLPLPLRVREEWLLVVDGTVVVRAPDGEHTLKRGDLVCFPPGPAGAHKLMNRSASPARTLMFSSSRVPAVSVYPDSDKIAVWPGHEPDELIFRRAAPCRGRTERKAGTGRPSTTTLG